MRPSTPPNPGNPSTLTRRDLLARGAAAAVASGAALSGAFPAPAGQPARRYRVAVIGHTGRGNYGHGLDTVWREVPRTEVVAVADADPKGLADAVKRLGGPKGYPDYRKMLDEVKPDLVAVAPRWLDQHRDMVVAAAEGGARGVYMEKPMCRTLAEADQMVAACRKHNVKFAIAYQTRYSPRLKAIEELIAGGKIGRVIELRARGKEDARGGGEDLWVLGSHVLNLADHLGGGPLWCFGTVLQSGRPIQQDDVKPGAEGIGLLAGDEVHAAYRMKGGAAAYFDSVRSAGGSPTRFGLSIFGSAGIITMGTGYLPPVYLLQDSSWSPGQSGKKWLAVTSAGADKPEPLADAGLHGGNVAAVNDLLDAIEKDRSPVANVEEARTSTEMIVGVFASQRAGGPAPLPLKERENPLREAT